MKYFLPLSRPYFVYFRGAFSDSEWTPTYHSLFGRNSDKAELGTYQSQLRLFFREGKLCLSALLIRSIYTVGYADLSETQNLVVASDHSYTSLSFEEISPYGQLTHLEFNCPKYDNCIHSCAFNASSTKVAISLGSDSILLWDVQSRADVATLSVSSPVRHLQRFISEDCWMGMMGTSLLLVDGRSHCTTPSSFPFHTSCFCLSPNKQYG